MLFKGGMDVQIDYCNRTVFFATLEMGRCSILIMFVKLSWLLKVIQTIYLMEIFDWTNYKSD
jgi:hypothetical protein